MDIWPRAPNGPETTLVSGLMMMMMMMWLTPELAQFNKVGVEIKENNINGDSTD